MKVYLVEKLIVTCFPNRPGIPKMEPVALKTKWYEAHALMDTEDVGIITEIEIDKDYPEGIGVCRHWHYPDEVKEDNGIN